MHDEAVTDLDDAILQLTGKVILVLTVTMQAAELYQKQASRLYIQTHLITLYLA